MNLKLNELSWILQENLIDKTANNEYFRSLESQPIFREKIFVDFTAKKTVFSLFDQNFIGHFSAKTSDFL